MTTLEKSHIMERSSDTWNGILSLVNRTKSNIIKTLRKERRGGSYILRTSQYTATRQHFCCCCMQYIQPGQRYEKMIQSINHRIFEWKTHSDPVCDFPEDPIERYGVGIQKEDINYQEAA